LIREDGALSILRGFRPGELRRLALNADLANVQLIRRFPFRLVLSGESRRQSTVASSQ
jgi:hypothetical protein